MQDVLERTPLAVSRYGTDLEPKVPRSRPTIIKHRPLGQSFGIDDVIIWNPMGALGAGRQFLDNLQSMSVLNSFSLDFALLVLGWPSSTMLSDSPILFPGTEFKSNADFEYIRIAFFDSRRGKFRSSIHLVSQLTGREFVARLRQSG